jgi:hypothetical protein
MWRFRRMRLFLFCAYTTPIFVAPMHTFSLCITFHSTPSSTALIFIPRILLLHFWHCLNAIICYVNVPFAFPSQCPDYFFLPLQLKIAWSHGSTSPIPQPSASTRTSFCPFSYIAYRKRRRGKKMPLKKNPLGPKKLNYQKNNLE